MVVLTNLYYSEAPWLTPRSAEAGENMVWSEVALSGNCAHEFEQQIVDLQGFLSENWHILHINEPMFHHQMSIFCCIGIARFCESASCMTSWESIVSKNLPCDANKSK